MSSTRSVIAPPPFAANALTVIPPTPVAGVSYRDPAAGPASSPDGWPYAERVNSAEFNQIMYQLSSLLSIIDKKGILGWSNTVEYTEAGTVFGSDGALYVWSAASGPTNGGAKDPISTSGFWSPLSSAVSLNAPGAVNLRCSIASASSIATFTADSVTVTNPSNGKTYRRPAFNKTADISGTGVGKMDNGAAPANGFVATYAIYNETTNTDATLSQNATAAVAPETYTGAFMPAGYTASALIDVLPTNGSSQFKPSTTLGRKVWPDLAQVLSTTTPQGTLTLLSIAGGVPRNAKTFDANLTVSCAVAGVRIECSLSGSPSPSPIGFTIDSRTNVSAGLAERFSMKSIPVITNQATYYIVAPSSGALGGFNIDISSYTF